MARDVQETVLSVSGKSLEGAVLSTTPVEAYWHKHSDPHLPYEPPRLMYTTPLDMVAYWKYGHTHGRRSPS